MVGVQKKRVFRLGIVVLADTRNEPAVRDAQKKKCVERNRTRDSSTQHEHPRAVVGWRETREGRGNRQPAAPSEAHA